MKCVTGVCVNIEPEYNDIIDEWVYQSCATIASGNSECARCDGGICYATPDGTYCGAQQGCKQCSSGVCAPAAIGERCPRLSYNCGRCNSDGECAPDPSTVGLSCFDGGQDSLCCTCDSNGEPDNEPYEGDFCGAGDDVRCHTCQAGQCQEIGGILNPPPIMCGDGTDEQCQYCDSGSCLDVMDGQACYYTIQDDDSSTEGWGHCESGACIYSASSSSSMTSSTMEYGPPSTGN